MWKNLSIPKCCCICGFKVSDVFRKLCRAWETCLSMDEKHHLRHPEDVNYRTSRGLKRPVRFWGSRGGLAWIHLRSSSNSRHLCSNNSMTSSQHWAQKSGSFKSQWRVTHIFGEWFTLYVPDISQRLGNKTQLEYPHVNTQDWNWSI